jgi:hypothetical protein
MVSAVWQQGDSLKEKIKIMKIRKIKTVEYILKNELEETKPSKFYLTDLNPYQAADVYDILTKNGSVTLNINVMIKAAELGISD